MHYSLLKNSYTSGSIIPRFLINYNLFFLPIQHDFSITDTQKINRILEKTELAIDKIILLEEISLKI